MHQILFQAGFFTLRSYGLVILLAIFLGTQVAITMARFTAGKFEKHIVPLVYVVLIAAIVGARFWQGSGIVGVIGYRFGNWRIY